MEWPERGKMRIVITGTGLDGEHCMSEVEVDGLPSVADFDLGTREGFLRDLGKLEGAVLEGRDAATMGFLETFMDASSKKKAPGRPVTVQTMAGPAKATVAGDLAASMKPKEGLGSLRVTEAAIRMFGEQSFRKGCATLGDLLPGYGEGGFRPSTWCGRMEREGALLDAKAADAATAVFRAAFPETVDGGAPSQEELGSRHPADPALWEASPEHMALLEGVAREHNRRREPPAQITRRDLMRLVEPGTSGCVYIFLDEVGVKMQKASRGPGSARNGRWVETTVIEVLVDGRRHVLTAPDMEEGVRRLLAFLMGTGLPKGRRLYFFSDGASNIRTRLEETFSFTDFVLILDWFHLARRVRELLSMALKGGKEGKAHVRRDLNAMLWVGNVDGAVGYLRSLPDAAVKDAKRLQDVTDYLVRKKPHIACHALRQKMGLPNSSSPAEKCNDLLVASRQKHNGMSWSSAGSHALSSLAAVDRNGGLEDWLLHRRLPLPFGGSGLPTAA